ncbi:hypothetical protein [Gemmatimonas sp.]|uniref:hypothetical protein n=1 Tax=Gemmatimonas sp. TaxID=1962908 RepID=UPI00286D9D72|nr:hypothetical protein [Gemmatimonas sp.]
MTVPPVPPRYTRRSTPALDRLRRIARQLGALCERVVFIGGAVAPLLQSDDVIPRVRPTNDVDAVIATSSYAELGPLRDALRARGFSEAAVPPEHGATTHMHRWIAPDGGGPFDLVPVGEHPGGTGAVADAYAVESAVRIDLRQKDGDAPCIVRHASPVAFLMLKWAAFSDRGRESPFDSHDLEDIIGVMASRPTIVTEGRAAPLAVRRFLAEQCRALLADADMADELMAAHLPAGTVIAVRESVRQRLQSLCAIDQDSYYAARLPS